MKVSSISNADERDESSRRVMQQLVKKFTLPGAFIRKASPAELVNAVKSAPFYAVSLRASLAEALGMLDEILAQAQHATDEPIEESLDAA